MTEKISLNLTLEELEIIDKFRFDQGISRTGRRG